MTKSPLNHVPALLRPQRLARRAVPHSFEDRYVRCPPLNMGASSIAYSTPNTPQTTVWAVDQLYSNPTLRATCLEPGPALGTCQIPSSQGGNRSVPVDEGGIRTRWDQAKSRREPQNPHHDFTCEGGICPNPVEEGGICSNPVEEGGLFIHRNAMYQ